MATNFAFAQVIGGDYAFSPVTSIGTNERLVVALHPRCALVGIELPARSLVTPLTQASLQLDSWDDKQTGQKRTKMRVVGEIMQFLGGPREGGAIWYRSLSLG